MKFFSVFVLITLVFYTVKASAQNQQYRYELTVGHDNDFTIFGARTDWHYTYGIHLDVGWIPKRETGLSKLFASKQAYMQRIGVHIQAYTPDYAKTFQIVKTRQPYAGWGYTDFTSIYAFEKSFLKFKLDLGILGPAVQAGEIQNFIHKYISLDKIVNQWEDQIPNKLGVNLHATYARDLIKYKWLGMYGIADISAGNIFSFAEPGIHLRLGKFNAISKSSSRQNQLLSDSKNEFFMEASVATKFSFYNATIEDADANGTFLVPDDLVDPVYLNASLGAFFSFSKYALGLNWHYTEGEIKGNKPHRYVVLKASYRFN